MSSERQEIADKIRDGSYYTDARNWYSIKYLYPISERSMMFLFTIVALFALIPIALLFHNIAQTNNQVPFPINVPDSTYHVSVIRPLAKKSETAQEAVAKYLISDYVKSREEYIHQNVTADNLKKLLKKIKSSSAKPILNEYVSYMNENNPYSPLIRYKDHTNRFIKIKSLSFLDHDQTSGKAKVIFEATEESIGTIKKSTWEVAINFRLPDVATIARTGAPLRFIVGYYRAKLLDTAPLNNSTKNDTKRNEVISEGETTDTGSLEGIPATPEDKAPEQKQDTAGQEEDTKKDEDESVPNINNAVENPVDEPVTTDTPNKEN